MPLGYQQRKTVHAAVAGVQQRDRFERRLPTHAFEGPWKRPGLLRRLVERIRRRAC